MSGARLVAEFGTQIPPARGRQGGRALPRAPGMRLGVGGIKMKAICAIYGNEQLPDVRRVRW